MRILKRYSPSRTRNGSTACITTRSDEDTETSSRCSPPRRHSSCITTRSDEDTETQYLYESMYLTKLLASPPDPMRILKPWTAGMLQNPIQLASPPDPMRILKPNAVSRAVVAATTCITTRSDEDTETTEQGAPASDQANLHHHPIR